MLKLAKELADLSVLWYISSIIGAEIIFIICFLLKAPVFILFGTAYLLVAMFFLSRVVGNGLSEKGIKNLFAGFIASGVLTFLTQSNYPAFVLAIITDKIGFILYSDDIFNIIRMLSMFYCVAIGILLCASWTYLALSYRNS
jgi:hypothetical protein